MNGPLQDLRYALRQLRKSPGSPALRFWYRLYGHIRECRRQLGLVDAALIKPLPYANPRG